MCKRSARSCSTPASGEKKMEGDPLSGTKWLQVMGNDERVMGCG
jgi:hypothetical protein